MSDRKPIVFLFFLVRPLIIASRDNIHFDEKYRHVLVSRDLVTPLLSCHLYSIICIYNTKLFKSLRLPVKYVAPQQIGYYNLKARFWEVLNMAS